MKKREEITIEKKFIGLFNMKSFKIPFPIKNWKVGFTWGRTR